MEMTLTALAVWRLAACITKGIDLVQSRHYGAAISPVELIQSRISDTWRCLLWMGVVYVKLTKGRKEAGKWRS